MSLSVIASDSPQHEDTKERVEHVEKKCFYCSLLNFFNTPHHRNIMDLVGNSFLLHARYFSLNRNPIEGPVLAGMIAKRELIQQYQTSSKHSQVEQMQTHDDPIHTPLLTSKNNLVGQDKSTDFFQRMNRLQALMTRSTQTQSFLCASTKKWKRSSHVIKMRKSALSRNKILQDIFFKFHNWDAAKHDHSSLGDLKRPEEDAVTNNQHSRASSDSGGRIGGFQQPVGKTEQKHRIPPFNADQLLSLVETYQRSRKVEPLGGDYQSMCVFP